MNIAIASVNSPPAPVTVVSSVVSAIRAPAQAFDDVLALVPNTVAAQMSSPVQPVPVANVESERAETKLPPSISNEDFAPREHIADLEISGADDPKSDEKKAAPIEETAADTVQQTPPTQISPQTIILVPLSAIAAQANVYPSDDEVIERRHSVEPQANVQSATPKRLSTYLSDELNNGSLPVGQNDDEVFASINALSTQSQNQFSSAMTHVAQSAPSDAGVFIERQLDLADEGAWLDSLARDIVAAGSARDRLSFVLHPAKLGRLDVDLAQVGAGLSVQITTSTDDAAKIVSAAQPRLLEDLRSQGVRVADAGVNGGQHQSPSQQQSFSNQHPSRLAIRSEFSTPTPEDLQKTQTPRPTGRFA